MKVIFLDVDGVLNSYQFFNESQDDLEVIDERCLQTLKKIVDATGAKIVLSSSWRSGWSTDAKELTEEGELLNDKFAKYGLEIYSKTKFDRNYRREVEVVQWMKECDKKITGFLILDDGPFQWGRQHMQSHVIKTDFDDGGLQEKHIKQAIDILNYKKRWYEKLFVRLKNGF